jgi:hypothetical protein
MLIAFVIAATPFPPPTPTSLENCSRAACTAVNDVRVCKCLKPTAQALDLLVVDRALDRRVIWVTESHLGEVTDFRVQQLDLDADGANEIVVASVMSESSGMAIRSWDVSIVDGKEDLALHVVAHDFGFDALKGMTLQLTEWAWQVITENENALVFTGREYVYAHGALRPTKRPVLRRRYTTDFETERLAALERSVDRTLPGRTFLSHASTTKGTDAPPRLFRLGTLKAVTGDEPEYELHAEDEKGQLITFSSDGESGPVLRLGDLKSQRLFPLRYWPRDLENSLLGRHVMMGLTDRDLSGIVFVQ